MEYHCIYDKYKTDKSEINEQDLDFENPPFQKVELNDLQDKKYYFIRKEQLIEKIDARDMFNTQKYRSEHEWKEYINDHQIEFQLYTKQKEIEKSKKYIGQCEVIIEKNNEHTTYSDSSNLRSRYSCYKNTQDGKLYSMRESLFFINVMGYIFDYNKNKYVCKGKGDITHRYRKYTFYILPGFTEESCEYQKQVVQSIEDENPWMHTIHETQINDTLLKQYMGLDYSQDTNNDNRNPIKFGLKFPKLNYNYNPSIVPYQPAKPADAYSDNIAIGEIIQNVPEITKNKDYLHNYTVRNNRNLYHFGKTTNYPKIPKLTKQQQNVFHKNRNQKNKKGGNKTRKGKRKNISRKGKRKGFIYNM